jgi:4-diphosphocytidyl-2-C-methyl-D-erythritol kinase
MQETAYAKINLALHVRERRADGYHRLETLFAFAQHGDVLTAERADRLSLTISGPFSKGLSSGPDNLVLRAALALQTQFAVNEGAALILDKRLPIAAGIGGGSADAAATLRLLARLWSLNVDDAAIMDIAASLGADVPACVVSRTMRGDGVGDILTPVDSGTLSGLPLLLVNPLVACPTGPVFEAWDGIDRGPLGIDAPLIAARGGRNDLAAPAIELVPEIGSVLHLLAASGPMMVRMSGSGATCFAIYTDAGSRDSAARTVPEHWWHLATTLRA